MIGSSSSYYFYMILLVSLSFFPHFFFLQWFFCHKFSQTLGKHSHWQMVIIPHKPRLEGLALALQDSRLGQSHYFGPAWLGLFRPGLAWLTAWGWAMHITSRQLSQSQIARMPNTDIFPRADLKSITKLTIQPLISKFLPTPITGSGNTDIKDLKYCQLHICWANSQFTIYILNLK